MSRNRFYIAPQGNDNPRDINGTRERCKLQHWCKFNSLDISKRGYLFLPSYNSFVRHM